MSYEYRAVLRCEKERCDCCEEDRRIVLGKVFEDRKQAAEYGKGMRLKVYGTQHIASVEQRYVGRWERSHG